MSELRDKAIGWALEGLGPDGQLLPFVLATMRDGTLGHFTIVVDRSDKAFTAGRRIVLERANEIEAYAIAVDAYLRIDDVRHDAVLVETGVRGDDVATVTGYPYTRAAGKATASAPVEYERRPTALRRVDPRELAWSQGVTPDFYNEGQNHAVHVVNHDLESSDNVTRTIRFLRGRAERFARALPDGARQTAFVDDRGQRVTSATREQLARGLAGALDIDYLSEREA